MKAAGRREGPKLLISITLAADRCRDNCYYQLKYPKMGLLALVALQLKLSDFVGAEVPHLM